MTQRERLQRRRHHHAALHVRLDVEIVRHFQVVDDHLQRLIDFALRRHQSQPLQAVGDVVFGFAVPRALRLDRRQDRSPSSYRPAPASPPESCSIPVPARLGRCCSPTAAFAPGSRASWSSRSAVLFLRCTQTTAATFPAARSCASCRSGSNSWFARRRHIRR